LIGASSAMGVTILLGRNPATTIAVFQ